MYHGPWYSRIPFIVTLRVASIFRYDHGGSAVSGLESISVEQLVCGGSVRMTLGSTLPAFPAGRQLTTRRQKADTRCEPPRVGPGSGAGTHPLTNSL